MPLEAPPLDIRTFDELVREAQLRIPRYTREWTDFNDSDPGMTLVQLFAWLTEMMLYQMNRVPERNYIKFLQLLNLELEPAQPAVAHLTFTAQPGVEVGPVRARTQIAAQPPEGGDLLIFETEEGLDLIRVPLQDIQVFDGTAFSVITPANDSLGLSWRPLGWVPQVGSALYLGFAPTNPAVVGRPFPQQLRFRVFLPAVAQAGVPQSCREAEQPPAPSATLVWEYKPTAYSPRWRRLNIYKDESVAFTREGDIVLEGPSEIALTPKEGKIDQPRYWLRCRLAGGSYPAGHAPEIDGIRPNTVRAVQLSTVREELVGISEGHPDQSFTLRFTPVQPDSLELWIEIDAQEPELWTAVEDFLASGADAPHYVLRATTGEIRFGDGRRGRIPAAGAEIVARQYRYGGGLAGNVGAGLINAPLTSLVGVEEVVNLRPAVGGRNEQTAEDLKEQAPRVLLSRQRAVTAEDYQALAEKAGGVSRAVALPLAHPDHPGVEVPGAVTVVIVPDTLDVPPQPSSDLIRQVCNYLDRFRLLTAEVYVKGPAYQQVSVEARVAAQPSAAFDAVAQEIAQALNAFLDPRRWRFGQELYPTSLYSEILRVANVVAVPSLTLTVNGRPHDSLAQPVILPRDGLVYGVDHAIHVVPVTDL